MMLNPSKAYSRFPSVSTNGIVSFFIAWNASRKLVRYALSSNGSL